METLPSDHSGHWMSPASSMLSEDLASQVHPALSAGTAHSTGPAGDMFFHPAMDNNANHATSYYNPASRTMHGYRSAHSKIIKLHLYRPMGGGAKTKRPHILGGGGT